jgi:hypothetical protein
MRPTFFALALALAAPPAFAAAQEPTGGAKVYKQALPSVVWIHSTRDRGLATGSGTLIDRDRRLVLTNYHVVEDNPKATAFFPVFRDGSPVSEKRFYADRLDRLGYRGRVVATDKQADLAVIQLETLPEGVKATPLATASPSPGESVHSIGNTGKSGALWGYVKGTVRQVYRKKWKAALSRSRTLTFEAKVIETDSPTNPGDSGGPLLNDAGELVGVTQGGAVDANLVSFFVDVSEVKQLLATRAVSNLRGGKPASATAPKRTSSLTVSDKAKLFSADAVKAADQTVAELFKKGLDVLVETHPSAPADWVEKAKKAKPEERQKMFREWAGERIKAEKVEGVVVLVCLEPRSVAVDIAPGWEARFPPKYAQKVADALIQGLKDKKADDGLANALKLLHEGYEAKK